MRKLNAVKLGRIISCLKVLYVKSHHNEYQRVSKSLNRMRINSIKLNLK